MQNSSHHHPVPEHRSLTFHWLALPVWLALLLSLVGFPSAGQVSFDPANFTFEAEDFNFEGGGFFDNPDLCDTIGGAPNCYFDRVGYTNIDKLELDFEVTINTPFTNEVYRFGSGLFREEWVDTFITDDSLVRTQYSNAGLPDWEVRSIAVGEWLNYTRTYPAGNYNLYMRAASGTAVSADLHLVSGATTTNQTLTYVGRFFTTNVPSGYEFIPLTDFTGSNDIVLTFSGSSAETLRVTANSAGFTPNFYMLVSSTNSQNLPPLVTITNPAAGTVLLEGVPVTIGAIASDAESTVTNVQFYAGDVEPLTFIGETNMAPYTVSWTPPSLGSIRTYTIRVLAADDTGLVGADQVTVEVRDPAIQFVTTAEGNGADAEMREQDNLGVSSGGNYGSVRARTYTANNEIVALRFDLSGQIAAKLTDVKVNLTCMRDDDSNRQLTLYGVTPGTAALAGPYTTDDWDESALDQFAYMPGLLPPDGNTLTQNLDTNTVTALAGFSGEVSKGEIKTFESQALTDFVRGLTGSNQVTFLVAFSPGYVSSGQARYAAKEASTLDGGVPSGEVGDFAPSLQFKVLTNALPFVTITNPADSTELQADVEVALAAEANDVDGTVTNVDFYVGTAEPLTLVGSDSTAPYSVPWTTPNSNAVTAYTIRAIATDNVGQSAEDNITVTVNPPFVDIVSSAVGDGADVEMQEQDNDSSNGTSMNVRTSPNGDRNEIIGLRFDLSGKTLSNLFNIRLNLVAFRQDGSTRVVDLYGVAQGTAAPEGSYTTENWDETALTTFGSLPGLLATDGNYLTQSIDSNHVTYLGQVTVPGNSVPKGGTVTFDDPALTTFIQGYSGSSKVTFLLAGGSPSTGQFRIASKEATALDGGTPTGSPGDFAPYLEFQDLPSQPPVVAITNPEEGATLDGGVEVIIAADATDIDGSVTNVDFYAGTTEPLALLGSDTTPPYILPWTPVAVNPINAYIIRVVATDDVGFSSEDSINVTVVNPALISVSTAVGSGADTEMREQDDPDASRNTASDLNTRFTASDRNEVVGLRFDLTGYTLSELENVAINLVNYRDNSTRVIDIYGVTQGASGGSGLYTTETWTDSGGSSVQAWGDLPGLLMSDGDVATPSLDTSNLTLLVDDLTVTKLAEGTVEQATSAALTSFVQDYSGSSLITFLITAGNTSGGQFRFASKEATALTSISGAAGDFAPYLSFSVGPITQPRLEYTLTAGGTTIDFSWTGSYKLQFQTNSVDTGLSANWVDYPGGGTSPVSVPVDKVNGTVFFRLAL